MTTGLGSFLRCALIGASASWVSLAALAQTGPPPEMAQAETRSFDIPPQPLDSALLMFGQQSGRQIVSQSSLVSGLASPGVQGTLSVEGALQRLLAGTGLTYTTSGRAISLQRAGQGADASGVMQLDPVQVQGFPVPAQAMIDNLPPPYAGGQVATGGQLGMLGNREVMDTPFNQTSYTARTVQEQQAHSVRDVLINDPSVQMVWPNGTSSADAIRIRGFDVGGDVAYGGLYGVLPYWSITPEIAERVEVLKGASAMLQGMPPVGGVGGAINVVPKRAKDTPITQATLGYMSSTNFSGHVDVGRRFGADNQFGARFNGVYRAGNTSIANNTDTTGLTALSLDFRGERVRVSADMGYQYQRLGGLVASPLLAAGIPVPSAPIASHNFGQPWSYVERRDLFGAFRGEVDITDNVMAYAAFGAHDTRSQSLEGGYPFVSNLNGSSTQTPFRFGGYYTFQTWEAGIRANVDTGPINHALSASATQLLWQVGFGNAFGPGYASNIYNPTYTNQPNIADPVVAKSSVTNLSSIAFADTLSAAEKRIQLTVGARIQNVALDNFNPTGMVTASYNQNAVSPAVALVVKPWKNISVYGNFIQGLQQGTTVGTGFANAGQSLPPYKTTQYEVGVKVDWGQLTTTLSAFQMTQPSALTNTTSNTLEANGEQRNRGIEFNLFGEPMPGVRLLGGIMLLDAVLTKTAGGVNDGWRAPGTPDIQATLGGEWDTPFWRGFTVTGRFLYTGSQYFDVAYPRRSLPDWARVDLGARYTFEGTKTPTGQPVVIRFTVENVFDANYWSSAYASNFLMQGSPRTFRLSTTLNF